jgi:hypothetical protein
LSKRFYDYIEAGFSWAIPSMFLMQIQNAISPKTCILLIQGNSTASADFRVVDPKTGAGAEISVEARRMGADPGDDVLYEWGSIMLHILHNHFEKVQNAVSEDERQRFHRWLLQNPIKSII